MKALNRKEVLVNAKANGTLDSFKPLTRDEAFTKKALELGGGASSWNDLTDKPFGEEIGEVVLLEPTTIVSAGGEDGQLSNPFTVEFVQGETYQVIWDGNKYEVTAEYVDMDIIVGNKTFANATYEDTGEPFCIVWWKDDNEVVECVLFCEESANGEEIEHTIAIKQVKETVKTLDPKYLPVMTVNILKTSDQNTFTSDKSFAEILAHLDDGGDVICWYKGSAAGAPSRAYLRFYNNWTIHFTIIDIVPDLEGGSLESCTLKSLTMSSTGVNYYTSRSIAFGS